MNHSAYEYMGDIYHYGVDIPIENRTFVECFREYVDRYDLVSEEEFLQKFNATLTKAVGASKARKMLEYHKARVDFDRNAFVGRKPGVNNNLVSNDFS